MENGKVYFPEDFQAFSIFGFLVIKVITDNLDLL